MRWQLLTPGAAAVAPGAVQQVLHGVGRQGLGAAARTLTGTRVDAGGGAQAAVVELAQQGPGALVAGGLLDQAPVLLAANKAEGRGGFAGADIQADQQTEGDAEIFPVEFTPE